MDTRLIKQELGYNKINGKSFLVLELSYTLFIIIFYLQSIELSMMLYKKQDKINNNILMNSMENKKDID